MEKLYLGAAYYPEIYGFDLPTMEEDIRWMKKGGFNVMRVGEFSWSFMEPEDGQFDFSWLHKIVDKLWEEGIHTLMCTPSATPPQWLTVKYPETLMVDESGRRKQHGARRQCCSNSGVYRKYTVRIVKKLGEEFANHPGVIGWQLDNEISPEIRGCSCDLCMAAFHERLRRKYGDIKKLNDKWYLGLWSQEYASFDDVPHPDMRTWSNPSLIAEYINFQSDSHAEFIRLQAETLRESGVSTPIGTDMMVICSQHYPRTVAPLDVVQLNHYNHRDVLDDCPLWFNYVKNLKPDRPFWVTETSTSHNGSAAASPKEYPTGFNRVNSLLPYAFGAAMNNYWLWRAHPIGHELMHGSVITTQGRPVHNFDEIVEISKILNKAEPYLTKSKIRNTGFAMHFSCTAGIMFGAQPTVDGFHYVQAVEDEYKKLSGSGMFPAVIDTGAALDEIKVLYSPYLITMDENNLAGRVEAWVRGGGIWIAGPLTDIRNADGGKYMDSPIGMIERLTGVYTDASVPATLIPAKVEWEHDTQETRVWTDSFRPADGQTVLARYKSDSEEEPSPFDGHAAAVYCPVGKGGVIVLGTCPSEKALRSVVKYAFDMADIKPGPSGDDNVVAVPWEGGLLAVCEVNHKTGKLKLDGTYEDLLEGGEIEGDVDIRPYGFKLLRKG